MWTSKVMWNNIFQIFFFLMPIFLILWSDFKKINTIFKNHYNVGFEVQTIFVCRWCTEHGARRCEDCQAQWLLGSVISWAEGINGPICKQSHGRKDKRSKHGVKGYSGSVSFVFLVMQGNCELRVMSLPYLCCLDWLILGASGHCSSWRSGDHWPCHRGLLKVHLHIDLMNCK